MSHARWLTTANRLCRLYIATIIPSQQLKDIVTFILKVYAPAWFRIKRNKSCVNGPQNLFEIINACKYLKGAQKTVVQKSLQHNAYYAHPENILLAMIFDKTEANRQTSISRIESVSAQSVVRKFVVPPLNFNAKSCYSLINFNKLDITVPPLLLNLDSESLANLYNSDVGKQICQIPCHSQAVERSVKLVTEAASSVTDENRNGFILNTLSSRQKMPKFDNKCSFTVT